MGNFVSYYGELYSDKPVDMLTLDRMIGNLTLKLDEKDLATLGAPISMNEVREVLGNVPRGKTPGPDSLHTRSTEHSRVSQPQLLPR